jgi:hypothetical protein
MRLAWIVLGLLAARPAFADEPPPPPAPPPVVDIAPPSTAPVNPDAAADYRPQPMKKDIVVSVERDRDAKNIAIFAALVGGGALLGAVGVYYHLDSRDASNAVSPSAPTNEPWLAAQQAEYDRANSSALKAGILYGVGGAALIGSVIYLIVTEPGTETTVIHPHYTPTVAPAPGGAVLGGAWSF